MYDCLIILLSYVGVGVGVVGPAAADLNVGVDFGACIGADVDDYVEGAVDVAADVDVSADFYVAVAV